MSLAGPGECSLCILPYDSTEHFPMILDCGHTYCKKCIDDLKAPRCPNCSAPIDPLKIKKNYALVPEERKDQAIKYPQLNQPARGLTPWEEQPPNLGQQPSREGMITAQANKQLGIRCRNGHAAVWIGRKSECWKCSKQGTGWRCEACRFHQCDTCSGTYLSSNVCPNGDVPEWFGRWKDEYNCAVCEKKKVCLFCKDCNKTHCKDCRSNTTKIRQCKIHRKRLTYREDKYCGIEGCLNQGSEICEICRARCRQHNKDFTDAQVFCHPDEAYDMKTECTKVGCQNAMFWKCNLCELHLCNICGNTEMRADKCPNDHKTTWTGEKIKCAFCNEVRPGWKCVRCNYNLCDNCAEKGVMVYSEQKSQATCCSMM